VATFSPTRFRACREAADVSRQELARYVVRSEQTIRLWERGKVKPPEHAIRAIADGLGCTFADLHEPTTTPRRKASS
jgi:transcriptional regulator with XRE-family HTH domain